MYNWQYNDGKEMSQWQANGLPCAWFNGNCCAPFCIHWYSLTKTYFIVVDGEVGKAEFIKLLDEEPLGFCKR